MITPSNSYLIPDLNSGAYNDVQRGILIAAANTSFKYKMEYIAGELDMEKTIANMESSFRSQINILLKAWQTNVWDKKA